MSNKDNKSEQLLDKLSNNNWLIIVASIATIGVVALVATSAATPYFSIEPENDELAGCTKEIVNDASASGGGAIQFCASGSTSFNPGAKLPISYDLNSLGSNVKYVATNGSDSNNGTINSPYATLNKAISSSSSNGVVVVRGGIYRQGDIIVNKTIKIIAYPGEVPTINGAQIINGGWSNEGNLRYKSYTPIATPRNGDLGIQWESGQNLNGNIGLYPDQVWLGSNMLQQVASKSEVNSGKFYVDRSNNRIYLSSGDAASSNIEATKDRIALNVTSPNVTIEGLQFVRFAAHAGDQAALRFSGSADNSVMRNVEIYDMSFVAVKYYESGSNLNEGGLMKNVTIEGSNWMGINANYTTDLVLDSVKLNYMNRFNEFTSSPQSGGLKTSRTWGTQVINSEVKDNKSHGIWFDQSNYKSVVANSVITGNSSTSVFFEISDDLLMINNYISGGNENVKLAGSSGLKIINNTIVGGKNPIGIYVDSRSQPGCAANRNNCKSGTQTYSSDRDSYRTRPATMDWMPRIDYMVNNIIGYPSAGQYCAGSSPVCITLSHTDKASTTIQAVIHQANSPHNGVPKTFIDDNVYINGSGRIITTSNASYYDTNAFKSSMAVAPVSIPNLEAGGRHGNSWAGSGGTPSAALSAVHNDATPVPNNVDYNKYVPAGTKHYGVLSR